MNQRNRARSRGQVSSVVLGFLLGVCVVLYAVKWQSAHAPAAAAPAPVSAPAVTTESIVTSPVTAPAAAPAPATGAAAARKAAKQRKRGKATGTGAATPAVATPPAISAPPTATATATPAAKKKAKPASSGLPPLHSSQECVDEATGVIEARARLRVLEANQRFGPGSVDGTAVVSEFDDDPNHANANVVMRHHDCWRLHRCCQPLTGPDYDPDYGAGTTAAHVMVMVACSSGRREQCESIRTGGARDLKLHDRLWLWSDVSDTGAGTVSPPQPVDPEYAALKDKRDAYPILGAQWLLQLYVNSLASESAEYRAYREAVARTRWFVFVDDETFLNLPRLLEHLNKMEHRLPLAYGYVWRSNSDPAVPFNHLSGDAGFVLSRESFSRIVPRLIPKPNVAAAAAAAAPAAGAVVVPGAGANAGAGDDAGCAYMGAFGTDVAVSLCARRAAVLLVHSEMFQWTVTRNLWAMPDGRRLYLGVLSAITGHGMAPAEMLKHAEFCENNEKTFDPKWTPFERRRRPALPPL